VRIFMVASVILTVGACSPEMMHGGIHHVAAPSAAPHSMSKAQPDGNAASGDVTVNIQGDQAAWIANPNVRAFYDLTRDLLAPSAPKLDFGDYRDKSYAIFRALGTSMGASPEGMVDHLKDIPQQMVGIVKDDPKVLDNYDNFIVALMGPQ
jgi:hypothetical protein